MANHYVDSAAAGGGDGTIGTPWNTIAQVNGHTFAADDFIYFKCGSTFRETLTITQSGTAGHPITYGSYDSGALPAISGADLLATWTKHDTNIWKATVTLDYGPLVVLFDGAVGTPVASIVACDTALDWYWAANVLYVYAPGDADPSVTYATPGVEAGTRYWGITAAADDVDYITLQDFRIYGTGNLDYPKAIRNYNCRNWTYSGLTIDKNAGDGIFAVNARYHTVTGCTVTGIRALTTNKKGVLFDCNSAVGAAYTPGHNTVSLNTIQYWPDSAVQMQGETSALRQTNFAVEHNNLDHSCSGCYVQWADTGTIHENSCDDNLVGGYLAGEDYGIALQTVSNAVIDGNVCTNGRVGMEIWAYTGVAFPTAGPSDNNKVYQNTISGNTSYGFYIYEGNADNTEVYNNIIFDNAKAGIGLNDHNTGYESTGCTCYHNTLYCNDTGSDGYGDIYVGYACAGWTIKNNIIFNTNKLCFHAGVTFGGTHTNNCYYRATGNVIEDDTDTYALAAVTDFEATAIAADPTLANGGGTTAEDYKLLSGSPCIDAGVDVGISTDYFNGIRPVGTAPDIGANEYIPAGYKIQESFRMVKV